MQSKAENGKESQKMSASKRNRVVSLVFCSFQKGVVG